MFRHETVLREEAVDGLKVRPEGIYVDCTLGGGGHSRLSPIAWVTGGLLIGIDQDPDALKAARKRLAGAGCRIHLVRSNFRRLEEILDELQIDEADGFLFDLGVSSPSWIGRNGDSAVTGTLLWTCGWTPTASLRPMISSTHGRRRRLPEFCRNTARSVSPAGSPGALSSGEGAFHPDHPGAGGNHQGIHPRCCPPSRTPSRPPLVSGDPHRRQR